MIFNSRSLNFIQNFQILRNQIAGIRPGVEDRRRQELSSEGFSGSLNGWNFLRNALLPNKTEHATSNIRETVLWKFLRELETVWQG